MGVAGGGGGINTSFPQPITNASTHNTRPQLYQLLQVGWDRVGWGGQYC